MRNTEYIALRIARRFLFPANLQRWGRFLPYYRRNVAEAHADHVSGVYVRWLAKANWLIAGQHVIEVGSGSTNSAGYALTCAGAARVWCLEPYVAFDRRTDALQLARLAREHGRDARKIAAKVTRCRSVDDIPLASVHLAVSHSVLEHVADPSSLFRSLSSRLAVGGAMLHVVDYRDHFFKYPLQFLQFSEKTWRRFLDPGDLPRWRLYHHRAALTCAGFSCQILHSEQDSAEFAKVAARISADFDRDDPDLGVLTAVLYCVREIDGGADHDGIGTGRHD